MSKPHAFQCKSVTKRKDAYVLLHDASHDARSNRSSALANVEALTVLDRNWSGDLAYHLDVVSRHHHLGDIFGSFGPV